MALLRLGPEALGAHGIREVFGADVAAWPEDHAQRAVVEEHLHLVDGIQLDRAHRRAQQALGTQQCRQAQPDFATAVGSAARRVARDGHGSAQARDSSAATARAGSTACSGNRIREAAAVTK